MKSFLKKRRTKIILIASAAVLLCVAIAVSVYVGFFYRPTIALTHDTITVEYGDDLAIKPKELLATDDQSIRDTTTVDTAPISYKKDTSYPEVGTYHVAVHFTQKHKLQTNQLTVVVRDTIAPELTRVKDKKLEFSTTKKKPDYRSYFTTKDKSKSSISVDDKKVDYTKAGTYKIVVTAKDIYDNTHSETFSITIRTPTDTNTEQPSKPAPKSPSKTSSGRTYVQGILVVNKKHCLPSNYAPGEDPTAGAAMRRMIKAMQKEKLNISNSYSGYRSYAYQEQLYQGYVAAHGKAAADRFSARPGCSEHQSGLAFDFLYGNGQLADGGREAAWIAKNAHRYGFIVRYQPGKESITGYQAEAWHVRYIGAKATAIHDSGLTLEEYLGVSGGDY